ncbi:hypothetical protein [Lentzea indica]|uniref:hypothetical protein n=1 Tax=Lentzea indica TaxID=2604800 RepID=UPI001439C5A0|nr:hypothetical protein [Lentzea indica]
MCFMFGASKEHVHRMLGLTDDAKHDEALTGVEETPVSEPIHAWHSMSICVDPPP